MKVVLQRVKRGSVTLRDESIPKGAIGPGFLLLVGFEKGDSEEDYRLLAEKIAKLRIFEDAEGKTNLSLSSVGGEILSISQFTLAATLRHSGNRPSFSSALEAETAERFYHAFDAYLGSLLGLEVKEGVFGGDMEVELVNDGPFTLVLDSVDLGKEARP